LSIYLVGILQNNKTTKTLKHTLSLTISSVHWP